MESVLSTNFMNVTAQVAPSLAKQGENNDEGGVEMQQATMGTMRGEDGQVHQNDHRPFRFIPRTQSIPKKRAMVLTAFLACLSFSIIICNSFMSFVNDLLRDDAFLNLIDTYFNAHNLTKPNNIALMDQSKT